MPLAKRTRADQVSMVFANKRLMGKSRPCSTIEPAQTSTSEHLFDDAQHGWHCVLRSLMRYQACHPQWLPPSRVPHVPKGHERLQDQLSPRGLGQFWTKLLGGVPEL